MNSTVDNMELREYRRVKTVLNLTYDTPVEKIRDFVEAVRHTFINHPDTQKDNVQVVFHDLGPHSLDILVNFFVKVPDREAELKERQRILLDILRMAETLGIRFAFPTQTLHIESLPDKNAAGKSAIAMNRLPERMNIRTYQRIRRLAVKPAVLALLFLADPSAHATDMDPRSYSNIPIGMNFLIAGYIYQNGSVAFAPSIPIKNGELSIHSAVLAFSRSLDLWGKSGKVDLIFPAASLLGTAELLGQPRSRQVDGFADPVMRFYVNLFGAPALSVKDFATYRQNVIVGASLAVSAPGGQYDTSKAVNIGTNRWSFKPELGISKAWGPLTAELAAGAYFFTDNNQPFPGQNLQQAPLYTVQGHLIYNLGKGIWGAFDANYYTGGLTTTDGRSGDNRLENWRVGGTLAFSVSKHHSIKLYGSTGIYSRTGSDFDTVGIAWQYRWGEGF